MAIIVDKEQKKRDIALACVDLFIQKGIASLTVQEVARSANVGKGTIYEYFRNKEEIVFELIRILMQEHNEKKERKLEQIQDPLEKTKLFFEFFYAQEDSNIREIYKEYLSITLTTKNEAMIMFETEVFEHYLTWMQEIIEDAIQKGELKVEMRSFVKAIFLFHEGLFLNSICTHATKSFKEESDKFLETLFRVMKGA